MKFELQNNFYHVAWFLSKRFEFLILGILWGFLSKIEPHSISINEECYLATIVSLHKLVTSLKNYWGANKSELGKKRQYHLQIELSNFLISYRNYVY